MTIATLPSTLAVAAGLIVSAAAAEPPSPGEGQILFLREPAARPTSALGPRAATVETIDLATGTEHLIRRIHLTLHSWSPDGSRLAFVTGKKSALFVVDVGSGRARLLLREATSFAWSPDGQRLAAFGMLGGRRGLFVTNTSGKARRRLIMSAKSRRWIWAWSPDGKAIAYGFTIRRPDQDNENGVEGLALVDATGKEPPRLIIAAETILTPEWSPDGSKVAYVRIDGKYTCCELHVVDREGTHDQAVVGNQLKQALEPTWSPDGRLIAYCSCGQGGTGLHIIGVNGTGDRALGVYVEDAAWSPDGALIVGTRGASSDVPERAVVVVHTNGTGERTVATNGLGPFWSGTDQRVIGYVGGPVWSRSGRTFVYVGADGFGVHLYRVAADGGDVTQLTFGKVSDTWPQWALGGNDRRPS